MALNRKAQMSNCVRRDNTEVNKSLTSAVGTVLGAGGRSRVVLRAWLALGSSLLVLIKSNVTIDARVGSVVTVSSRRTVH